MSRDVTDLLQRTADEPTRPLDTGAVIGKAKRQTRFAHAGAGLGVVAMLALVSFVALPMVAGGDLELEIADGPEPDQAVDAPIYEGFTLGQSYVWRSEPGSPEDAGLAFAAEVLGWDDAAIIDRSGAPGDEPTGMVALVIENEADRTVELYLEATDTTPQVWEVTQLAAGLEHPISATEEPSMFWRPRDVSTGLHRAFEGTTGIAQIRTPERGTTVIFLDATDVTNAEISLEGHVDVGDPFCHNIQSTLLLFHDRAGEVGSAIGGRWYGDDLPDCDTTSTQTTDAAPRTTERAPEAGSAVSHWPIELVYRQYHRDYSLVFSGTSWSDWTLEAHGDDGGVRVFDQERDGRMMLDPESGEMIEDPRGNFPRGAGPALISGWRDSVGLIERVVVPLDQIPGGVDLVHSLGLEADDVEAYVTPNIVGFPPQLDPCTTDQESVAPANTHQNTRLPQFAEEGFGGEPTGVWLIAESFAYGDAASLTRPDQ